MPPENKARGQSPLTPRIFFLRWAINSLGVLAATQIVPGIDCPTFPGLLTAALLLGLLNAFLRPVLLVLSLPLLIVSLGLFLWIINASLLYLVGSLVKSFHVAGFPSALGGAAVISLVSLIGGSIFGLNRRPTLTFRASSTTHPRKPQQQGPGGPVIDV